VDACNLVGGASPDRDHCAGARHGIGIVRSEM
jgi:hypothetical protein